MKNRVFTGIDLKKTIAVSTGFTDCELQAAKFDYADLRGAIFMTRIFEGHHLGAQT
jgi:uncharacterized protein YjbI with pentapeptide repeats